MSYGTMRKPRSRVILEIVSLKNVNVASREGFEDPAKQAETARLVEKLIEELFWCTGF